MNVLFFKENVDAQLLQLPDGLQQRDGVPSKAGDAFGDDHIDLPGAAGFKQALEVIAVVFGPRQGFVCVHAAVEPTGVFLD